MLFKSTTGAFFMFDLQYGTSNASQADQNRMPSLMCTFDLKQFMPSEHQPELPAEQHPLLSLQI